MARFTPHTDQEVRQMLDAIGVASVDDLFADIPPIAARRVVQSRRR